MTPATTPSPAVPSPEQLTVPKTAESSKFQPFQPLMENSELGTYMQETQKKPPTLTRGRLLDSKNSRSEELFVFRGFGLTCQFGSRNSRIGICFS